MVGIVAVAGFLLVAALTTLAWTFGGDLASIAVVLAGLAALVWLLDELDESAD